MHLVHVVGVSAGCALALLPALLPSARSGGRWPHVVMALGMAAGHLGFVAVAVAALLGMRLVLRLPVPPRGVRSSHPGLRGDVRPAGARRRCPVPVTRGPVTRTEAARRPRCQW